VNQLGKAVESCNCNELKELWEYIKYLRKEIKIGALNEEDEKKIYEFIENKKAENIYILPKGEIEDYLPEGYKNVENAIKLIVNYEDFNKWKETSEYIELENLMKEII